MFSRHPDADSGNIQQKQARALFLDRDGVINVNHGYVHRQEEFEFIDGVFDLARAACLLQYKIVVITNQAGIGRGYYSEAQFHDLTAWMCRQFEARSAPITRVYFSPYHPTEGVGEYKRDHFSRKPNPGMILNAQEDLNLDLASSVLVGDKTSDILAGIAGHVGRNLLFSQTDAEELAACPHHRIADLRSAIPLLDCRDPRKRAR